MKFTRLASISALAIMTAFSWAASYAATAETFIVRSSDIHDGTISNAQVLNGFGCHGENISPEIHWQGVPRKAKSLLLTIYDPDAPTGGLGWMHWVVANIPINTTSLPRGAASNGQLPPGAVQTNTDFSKSMYGGPCPPIGRAHRYIITVNALDIETLEVTTESSPALIGFMAHGHIIGKAKLIARYGRKH